ncbi:hypothetical protein GXW83_18640 [Streptacidiphilus sp. PB12-B1b]|uniref:hypothetical protein n=1 Tax=Streptacidiphilus sp. PB12-B1b TaxID=2705012 RepID=UPI0015F940FA|nr:hypothetical protein [Streptacidiphilus sp. PB12-B1b]QMU77415.1 hypothetical protein GXW83_18640 [Streptacidiphilus sp. PB12-B1b]
MSADDTHIPDVHPAAAGPVNSRPGAGPGSGPLLEAVAVQRPVPELAQLVTILNESDRHAHAQEMLNTAAALRPVEDVAAMLPLLGGGQAVEALHQAAARRPVDELARLVRRLNESGQPAHAQEVLDTAATVRTVQDVAAMVPLLGDQVPADALHSAAARRPVEELAQLVGHLDQASASEAQQGRWRRRR